MKTNSHWLRPPLFEEEEKNDQASILHWLLLAGMALIVASELFLLFSLKMPTVFHISAGFALLVFAGCFAALRGGYIQLASWISTTLMAVLLIASLYLTGGVSSPFAMLYILVVLVAAVLLGNRTALGFAVAGAFGIGFIYFLEQNGQIPEVTLMNPSLLAWLALTMMSVVSGLILYPLTEKIRETLKRANEKELVLEQNILELTEMRDTLENKVAKRNAQLRASAEVGRAISFILDPNLLTREVVNLIADRFGFYYAAIFLTSEDGHWAVLRGASGQSGQKLLEQGHRLEIGGYSMVGTAISMRQPRIAFDVGEESVRFDNPLLPETRSEMAIPLILGDRVLGALDVQSTTESAFSQEDIETLQSVANQIAVAFENARLFEETKQQLDEIKRLNQRYLQAGWGEIPPEQRRAYQFSGEKISEKEMPDYSALEIAHQQRALHVQNENGVSILTVPIILRDQIFGAIQFKAVQRNWTTDEIALIEAVTHQAALSLENARLIQETQSRAEKEKLIGQVSSRIRETLDIETVLQTAVREMQKSLNLEEIEVRMSANLLDSQETS